MILVGGNAKEDKFKRILKTLGGKVIEDLDEDFDIYVTDNVLIRNSKLLLSLARGASVVGVSWILESQKKNKFIVEPDFQRRAERSFLINDKQFDDKYKCKLSQLYKQQLLLLEGVRLFVSDKIKGAPK